MTKGKDDRKKITLLVDQKVYQAAAIRLAELGGHPAGYSFQSVLVELLAQWAGVEHEAEGRKRLIH